MTQSLKIECLVTDLTLEGEIASFLVTKEQLTAGLSKKADLVDGKIKESNLPDFIANGFQAVNQNLSTLETSITDGIQSAKDYAEAYADEKLIQKADLVDGKVPQIQLPSVEQYEGLNEALNGVLDQARRDMIECADEIQRTKADLGEDGKVVRSQLPNYDKIPGLETVVTDLYDSKANAVDVETSFKESQDQLDAHSLLLQSLGSILPYNPSNTYEEGYVTLKDGSLQQLVSGKWIPFKINALNVVDLSGESQQQVNYNGGSKWHYRDGGYQENDRAVLDNGDIVRSTVDGNFNDPNVNMAKWVNLTRTGRLIDTRLYGLKVNTAEDQTAAIHAAFADNPECSNFYIPKGTIKANVVYPRSYINLVGDSMLTTIILPFDLTKPAVSFGKRLYPALTQLSINAGQDFTAEHLLDATDTRYMYLKEFDIKKTIKAGETHSYQTILIDQRPIVTSWTGYNTLDTVRATYGAYGYLSDVEKLNSVLSMKSCVFAGNGYFGIKTNIENGSMLSMDVAGNGTLQPAGTYDESQYGGMYLSGENSVVLGCWNEYNSPAGLNFSENNIYFHPARANNIVHNFGRNSRSNQRVKVFSQNQGQLINVSQADRATDDGLGRARPQQLIKNGCFKYFNAVSRPLGWLGAFNGTVTQETSDLPNGYNTGIKIISSAAGITNCIQDFYNSNNIAGSLIKDIGKWVGREVTFSFWLKNIGTVASSVRGGITTDANAYFGDGNYFATSEVGQWRKFICSRKITGTETRISFGFRVVGVGEGVIVTGASASDDCRVLDSQPKAITEDGGEIYGGLEVKGDLKVSGVISQNGDPLVGRPFQTGNNGLQNATSTVNTTNKYVGKFAWNANDSKLYYATGATATSAWISIDGLTTITPA